MIMRVTVWICMFPLDRCEMFPGVKFRSLRHSVADLWLAEGPDDNC